MELKLSGTAETGTRQLVMDGCLAINKMNKTFYEGSRCRLAARVISRTRTQLISGEQISDKES